MHERMCDPMIAFESEVRSASSLVRFRDMSKGGIWHLKRKKVLPSDAVKATIQHLFKLGSRI